MRVLVLGDYRQTVTVVRSLGRAGYSVTLGTDDARSSTALSRHICRVWRYDGACPARFLDQLEARLRAEQPEFVFTVGETPLRRLIGAAARFEPLATFVNPDPATIARCFDKRVIYELAEGLGIPALPWRSFGDAEGWRRSAREMGFPLVVKRKDSSSQVRNRKALILRSPEALEALLAEAASDPDAASLVLQKFGRGARHNCHIAAADGRLIAYFQQKVLRTDEPDGTGIGVAGVSVAPCAALREYCERLTRSLAYTGIGCIQFLVDERTGSVALLEFNARMDSTAALPYRLGYDFPRLAVELAAYARGRGPCPAGLSQPYPAGRAYHWLYGDLHAWVDCARRGRIGLPRLAAWGLHMLWAASSSYHLTWELRDPLPTLHAFWKKFALTPARRLPPGPKIRPGVVTAGRK